MIIAGMESNSWTSSENWLSDSYTEVNIFMVVGSMVIMPTKSLKDLKDAKITAQQGFISIAIDQIPDVSKQATGELRLLYQAAHLVSSMVMFQSVLSKNCRKASKI